MEMELDSPSHPTPPPVLPSGTIPSADAIALPPTPPSRQEPASPSPVVSPREDEIPLSPPRDSPTRRRRSKPPRTAPVDQSEGPAAMPRRKRRGARETCAAAVAASPRKNVRPVRRRLQSDGGREETGKEAEEEEAAGKARRRKAAARATAPRPKGLVVVVKEKGSGLALVSCPPTNLTRGAENVEQSDWEGLWEMVVELVMWKSPARSAFWFGSGSMLFFSSFSRDINFSPISVLCHFGVLTLVLAFFKDSIPQRQHVERARSFQLTEENVLLAARAVLPIANSFISVAQMIFSGDPSMTLKVLPVLLFGAKYGHLLTVWRLLATGFFSCFTLPKLHSCYSSQVHGKVKGLNDQILNAWKSCPRKKLVAAAAVTTCWNLVSVKTRIMAVLAVVHPFPPDFLQEMGCGALSKNLTISQVMAFVSLVALRYYYQYPRTSKNSEGEISREEQQEAMVIED